MFDQRLDAEVIDSADETSAPVSAPDLEPASVAVVSAPEWHGALWWRSTAPPGSLRTAGMLIARIWDNKGRMESYDGDHKTGNRAVPQAREDGVPD
jgi:hypothetical protein